MTQNSQLCPSRENVIPVILVDVLIHTIDHPWCWDATCPCHHDAEALALLQQQYEDGLLTAAEVSLRIEDRTLGARP